MKTIQLYIDKLKNNRTLTEEQSYSSFRKLVDAPLHEQKLFIKAFNLRPPTVQELLGAQKAILQFATPFEVQNGIDMVGTGGDGMGTFNITTASSLVVASANMPVIKHGGSSVSSDSGASDVIRELGIPYSCNTAELTLRLKQYHFAYLPAPRCNPYFKRLGLVRQDLKCRTILNILGPLTNPTQPYKRLIGVYHQSLIEPVAKVLQANGVHLGLALSSIDGLDEISVCSPTKAIMIKHGELQHLTINPKDFIDETYTLSEFQCSGVKQSAQIILDVFDSKVKGAKRDIIALNSAFGLLVAGCVDNALEGFILAKKMIESRRPMILIKEMSKEMIHE